MTLNLILWIATASMVIGAVYFVTEGRKIQRANKILAGVVKDLNTNPPAASFAALAAAGDRLAHELLWEHNREILDRWWDLRGGHSECSVCCSRTSTGNPDA